jgi:hypothetical protein
MIGCWTLIKKMGVLVFWCFNILDTPKPKHQNTWRAIVVYGNGNKVEFKGDITVIR